MSANLQLFRRARLTATTTLAVVGVAVLGLGGLAGCGSADSQADDPAASTGPSTGPDPSSPAGSSSPSGQSSAVGSPVLAPSSTPSSTTSSPTTSAATSTTRPATVFFVANAAGRPRLFGETVEVPAAAPLDGAVRALMRGPHDPDYRSSYHAGAFGKVGYDPAKGFTVVLADPALEQPGGLTRERARIAVQQLVYTLESAQGASKAPVTVVAGGHPVSLFGIDTSSGVKPAPQLATRGLVNVLSPADGATVSGTLTVRGEASSFEATVPWKLSDRTGKVVRRGSATAAGWERLYPWQARIDLAGLAPGTYTVTASTDDPSDDEGPGPTTDTKTITVK